MKVAIQMDHVSTIDISGDSTFVMGLEAEQRGHRLYHYTPLNLAMLDGRVIAEMQPMALRREAGNHFTLGDATARSEERRVGKECRSRWSPYH